MKFPKIAVVLFAGVVALPAVAAPLTGHAYLKDARVSLHTARAEALKTYPGHIVSQELERERGGSGLRYSFDVRKGAVTHEVGIDAKTGAVLENSVEGPNAD
jgi:Peptidase propeptide and YPEB domain.